MRGTWKSNNKSVENWRQKNREVYNAKQKKYNCWRKARLEYLLILIDI